MVLIFRITFISNFPFTEFTHNQPMEKCISPAPVDSEVLFITLQFIVSQLQFHFIQGYIQAFSSGDVDQYLQFFDEYGFVIIKDVLSADECSNTVNEVPHYFQFSQYNNQVQVWNDIEKISSFEGAISKTNPSTWGNSQWPQRQQLGINSTN